MPGGGPRGSTMAPLCLSEVPAVCVSPPSSRHPKIRQCNKVRARRQRSKMVRKALCPPASSTMEK